MPESITLPMEISRHLTPNLYVTNNDVEIIDSLVDNGHMFKSFSVSQVASYIQGEDFHLVIFFADDYDQGFTMYVVEDFSVRVDDLLQLFNALQITIDQGYSYKLFHAAKSRVEQMIHMAPTFRAMYGKKPLEEED
ncbi:MAG: hypothetical protein H7Y12_15410 [Sphingobacteriaceae bacterium]|nr:hypothetical protein [Cytophagaceae bacterium]